MWSRTQAQVRLSRGRQLRPSYLKVATSFWVSEKMLIDLPRCSPWGSAISSGPIKEPILRSAAASRAENFETFDEGQLFFIMIFVFIFDENPLFIFENLGLLTTSTFTHPLSAKLIGIESDTSRNYVVHSKNIDLKTNFESLWNSGHKPFYCPRLWL